MLVYGDVETSCDACALRNSIVDRLTSLAGLPAGLERHSRLVAVFLAAGDLVGGMIDRDGDDAGGLGMRILTALASAVDTSWRSGFVRTGDLHAPTALLRRLSAGGPVRTKLAEGYAFYALYPESYAEAGRLSGLGPDTRIIGIRSIGTTLSAMVAAALGAAPPVTVRPSGHPFDRRLEPGPALTARILAGDPAAFAIVDEGPGLSGSSFGAVIAWLRARGVAADRIHLFPSHGNGPGGKANGARREQWRASPKHLVTTEDLLADRLPHWVAGLVGPLHAPLRNLSGGAWRALANPDAPVAPQWEKLKFLAESDGGRWLVKFAGLGRLAEEKLELARRLHSAGFGPEVAGLCHGFLVRRWVDAPGLAAAPLRGAGLIRQLAAYLAFRAKLPAPGDSGAGTKTLSEMAIYNTGEALGDAAAAAMSARLASIRPSGAPARVQVDARMHPWEWLNAGGRLMKLDALDHASAHDFIGAQPVAWDLAGAIVEHDLSAADADALLRAFESARRCCVDRHHLDYCLACYLAFQLGAWTMATGAGSGISRRYRERLERFLASS